MVGGGVNSVSYHRSGVNSVSHMAQTMTQQRRSVNTVSDAMTNAMGNSVSDAMTNAMGNSVTNAMSNAMSQKRSGVNTVTQVTNAMTDAMTNAMTNAVTQDGGGHTVTKETGGDSAGSGDQG